MMVLRGLRLALVCLFIAAGVTVQGQDPSFPKPTEHHAWLAKFEGTWVTEAKGTAGPDQPPMECSGTLTSRSLGGFWIVNELTGDMGGMQMTGVQTIGYDDSKKAYVGTWVDSVTSFMWQYQGTLNEQKTRLTLEAEGPNMMTGSGMAKFRDIYEFKSDDEMVMTSQMQNEGDWITFMQGTAKKKKK